MTPLFCLLPFLCFAPPVPLVPDGAWGYVSFYNSRVNPDGTLRDFDPRIDGYPPGYAPQPMGPIPASVL